MKCGRRVPSFNRWFDSTSLDEEYDLYVEGREEEDEVPLSFEEWTVEEYDSFCGGWGDAEYERCRDDAMEDN